MNKFEQLIEYVINDEEAKAKELFHDIVVEKSRSIYESLMQEEAEEELDEAADEELDESEEELDESEEDLDEGMMGGDASDDLIDEVETEEESEMNFEGEEDVEGEEEFEIGGEEEGGFGGDEGGSDEPATKDDILNLEDKLDQLMAEFEDLMGDEGSTDGDGFGPDEGGDAIEMDDTEEMDEVGMMEAVSLKAAPKPVTAEGGDGKAGPVAFNSGAAGMASKPVHATGTEAKGRPAPGTKDLISDFQNKAGASMKDQKAAPKPTTSQASGVNTRTPFPKG